MDSVRKERRKNRHLNERFFIILEDFVNEYKIAKYSENSGIFSADAGKIQRK